MSTIKGRLDKLRGAGGAEGQGAIPQSRLRRDSSLYTREPREAGFVGDRRGSEGYEAYGGEGSAQPRWAVPTPAAPESQNVQEQTKRKGLREFGADVNVRAYGGQGQRRLRQETQADNGQTASASSGSAGRGPTLAQRLENLRGGPVYTAPPEVEWKAGSLSDQGEQLAARRAEIEARVESLTRQVEEASIAYAEATQRLSESGLRDEDSLRAMGAEQASLGREYNRLQEALAQAKSDAYFAEQEELRFNTYQAQARAEDLPAIRARGLEPEAIRNIPWAFGSRYDDVRSALQYIQTTENAGGDRRAFNLTRDVLGEYKAHRMTQEQRGTLLYLAGMGDYEGARKYLEGIGYGLNEAANGSFQEDMAQWAQEHPWQGAAANIASWPLAIPAWVDNTGEMLRQGFTGEYRPPDPNRNAYLGARFGMGTAQGVQNAAREAAVRTFGSETAGDVAAFLTGTGLSIGQNVTQIAAMGPFAMLGMGLSSAGTVTTDALDRGATADQAFFIGTSAGLIEAATEKIPLDNLFRIAGQGGKRAAKELVADVLKQSGMEATEEMVSEIAGNLVDAAVMGQSSEYQRLIRELLADNPGMTEQEARKRAFLQLYVYNVLLSGAGGFISGGVMGGSGALLSRAGGYAKTLTDGMEADRAGAAEQESTPSLQRALQQAGETRIQTDEGSGMAGAVQPSDGLTGAAAQGTQPAANAALPTGGPAIYGGENSTRRDVENRNLFDGSREEGYTGIEDAPTSRSAAVQGLMDRLNNANEAPPGVDEIMALPEIVETERRNQGQETISLPGREGIRQKGFEDAMRRGSWNSLTRQYSNPVRQERRMDIVIGLPGSGKSSVYTEPLSERHGSRVIDTDDYRESIPEYDGANAKLVHEEASLIKDMVLTAALDNGDNILLSTIGANAEKLAEQIGEYSAGGYQVYLHLNELPNRKAVARALGRFFQEDGTTGRYVSPELIISYGDRPTQTYLILTGQGGTGYANRQGVAGDLRTGRGQNAGDAEAMENGARGGREAALAGWDRYSNDVAYGEGPILIDSSGQAGAPGGDPGQSEDPGQGTVGAARSGFTRPPAGEQVPTQNRTVTGSRIMSEEEKARLRPGTHERVTEGMSLEEAATNFYSDTSGNLRNVEDTADTLLEKEQWTGVDQDTAQIAQGYLIMKARATGDWTKVEQLAAAIERQGTIAGQSLQARKKWVTQRGDNIVTQAARIVHALEGNKRARAEADGVLDTVGRLAQRFDAATGEGRSGEPGTTELATGAEPSEQIDRLGMLAEIIRDTARLRRTTGLFSNDLSKKMNRALDSVIREGDVDFLRRLAANGIVAIASDYAGTNVADGALQVRRMAMLSKASTIMRNLVSNNVFDPMDSLVNNIAVPLDILLSRKTGTRSVAVDKSWFSKAKREGWLKAIDRSMLEVGLDVDTDGGLGGRYEQGGSRTFKMSGGVVSRFLSTMEKFQGYAMRTTDDMQKGSIQAEVQRGIDRLYDRGLIADESRRNAGEEMANYRTFQDDSRLARKVLELRRGFGRAGQVVLPFAQVPSNLVSRAFEYSPLGLAKGAAELFQVLGRAHNGTLTAAQQARAVQDIGRGLSGTGLIAIAAALALQGVLRVSDVTDGDDDKEALERQSGQSGTQLNLTAFGRMLRGEDPTWRDGDKLMSIGFLDPINAMLSTGALIASDMEEGELSAERAVLRSLEGTLMSVMELPVMSVFMDAYNVFQYSDADNQGGRLIDAALQFGASQVSSFVPNFVKGLAQGFDPVQRDSYSGDSLAQQTWNIFKSGIPGLRQTVEPKQDSYGRDMLAEEDPFLRALIANVLPGAVTTYREDPLTAELHRLYGETGEAGFYPNKSAPGSLSQDGEKTELTREQQRQFQRDRGAAHLLIGNQVLASDTYRGAEAGDQAEIMNLVRSYAYEQAKAAALGEDSQPGWVRNAQQASQLDMSTGEWLCAYQQYGGSDGILGGSGYPKTVRMYEAGVGLDAWAGMKAALGTEVTREQLTAYIKTNFPYRQRRAVFAAWVGQSGWKNPF